jgi:hypothetical protein
MWVKFWPYFVHSPPSPPLPGLGRIWRSRYSRRFIEWSLVSWESAHWKSYCTFRSIADFCIHFSRFLISFFWFGWNWFARHLHKMLLGICELWPLDTVRPIYRTTAPLTSRYCILYIYSTNNNFFKTRCNVSFFSLQNAVYFATLTFLIPVLFTFYIQGVLKLKCQIPVPKG